MPGRGCIYCLALVALAAAMPALAQQPAQPVGPALLSAQRMEAYQQELTDLRVRRPVAADDGELRKQVEVQQKQIDLLEKMIRLLREQQQAQTATIDGRIKQSARRDQELANASDDLKEHIDAEERKGPDLPSTLRELFLPSRTNESPLSIYGTAAADFQTFQDRDSNFSSPVFSPHFYLLLNEQFLLEVNPEFRAYGVEVESTQLDWFFHDNFTLVLGRFYSPIGFFNERLHTSWIYKTPDRPLMFSQVLPASLSFTGAMLKGATYLWDLPVKLEYSCVVTNGLSLDVANPTRRDVADLNRFKDPFNDVNDAKAIGGRLGLMVPEAGLWVGVSALANGAYDRAGQHSLDVWDVDFSWHHGDWDVKFEYARVNQQSPFGPIDRAGGYAQVAYRCYDSLHPILQRLEGVARFDWVRFKGIDLARTGLDFPTRERIPVDRNRYTVGLNYYAYASLIFKVAFEVNDEIRFRELHDNGFLAQVTWGF